MLVPIVTPDIARLADLAVRSVPSPESQDDYRKRLREFLAWTTTQGTPTLCRATVREYKAFLLERGLAPATVNQALSAVKAMVREAVDAGLLDELQGAAICQIKGVPKRGGSCGRWLTEEQTRAVLARPAADTLQGKRDRAALALLFGCGLRRGEAARADVANLQQRDGRWCLVDLIRKRGKVHTVPVPAWGYAVIRAWLDAAEIMEGPILRGFALNSRKLGTALTASQIYRIVRQHSTACGTTIAPHDARRTAATIWGRAARAKGLGLESVRQQLGHDSITTTERYLQTAIDLESAACDLFDPGVE